MADKMADAQATAEAQAQLQDFVASGGGAVKQEGAVGAELSKALKGLGMGAAPEEANNGAKLMMTLYHAYDGRTIKVPVYQVAQRLTVRFPDNADVREGFVRKQTWLLSPPESYGEAYYFQCRLGQNQTDPEILAEIRTAGLAPTCRKRLKHGGFQTQYEADEHFRIKHPKRWAAYQRSLTRDTALSAKRSQDAMMGAIFGLLRAQGVELPEGLVPAPVEVDPSLADDGDDAETEE